MSIGPFAVMYPVHFIKCFVAMHCFGSDLGWVSTLGRAGVHGEVLLAPHTLPVIAAELEDVAFVGGGVAVVGVNSVGMSDARAGAILRCLAIAVATSSIDSSEVSENSNDQLWCNWDRCWCFFACGAG